MTSLLLLNVALACLIIVSTAIAINLLRHYLNVTTTITALFGRTVPPDNAPVNVDKTVNKSSDPHLRKTSVRRKHTPARHKYFVRNLIQIGIPISWHPAFFLIWACFVITNSIGSYGLSVSYTDDTRIALMCGWIGFAVSIAIPLQLIEFRVSQIDNQIRQSLLHVIQNLSIASQGSLDIAGSIQAILSIEDELNLNDVGTAILRRVEKRVRQGSPLDDALVEEAQASQVLEVIHTFGILAQCIRHGGPVTKQLTAISESIATGEELRLYEHVTKLPVKAAFPLALMFSIFYLYIFGGLFAFMISKGLSQVY